MRTAGRVALVLSCALCMGSRTAPAPASQPREAWAWTIEPGQQKPQKDKQKTVHWEVLSANTMVLLLRKGYLQPPADPKRKALRIGVVGNSIFGKGVLELAPKKPLEKPRPIPVKVLHVPDEDILKRHQELSACDVLVLASPNPAVHKQITKAFAKEPVLLVGTAPDMVAAGVHVEFFRNRTGKIAFELNHRDLVTRRRWMVEPGLVKLSRRSKDHRDPKTNNPTPRPSPPPEEKEGGE